MMKDVVTASPAVFAAPAITEQLLGSFLVCIKSENAESIAALLRFLDALFNASKELDPSQQQPFRKVLLESQPGTHCNGYYHM